MVTTMNRFSNTENLFEKSSLNPQMIIRLAEEKIRVKTISLGLRITEFFHDFDRLRSGYVTSSQFKRCLDTNLRLQLSNEEEQLLFDKYNLKHDGNICYRQFCDVINRKYPETTITSNPECFTNAAPPYLNSWRSTRHVGNEDESERLDEILRRIELFCKQRRIDVLTTMEQFDKHQMGEISESQFYRAFVGPNLSEDEMTLLRDKYSDPGKPGLINYLNFVQDLHSISSTNLTQTNSNDKSFCNSFVGIEQKSEQRSVQEILDEIRIATYKYRIRMAEFFKDYDKLRSGIMSENQFSSAISLSVGKQASLNQNDILKLMEFYRRPDGRIFYKEFVDSMDNAFNLVELEKKPLSEVHRPGQGILNRPLNTNFNPDEEDRLNKILQNLIEQIQKRRLVLFPFFKIYDRSKGFTRLCTKNQFGRVLRTLDLIPSTFDLTLICKKFEDRLSGDINYALFCQAVEQDFVAIKIESEVETMNDQSQSDSNSKKDDFIDTSDVNFNDLIARIRHHILINRIRVKEFFEDFDPLRLGTISQSRFVRVLSSLGLTGLDDLPLTEKQIFALTNHYRHPEQTDLIIWKQFEQDLETVFTLNDLDKSPSIEVSSQNLYEMATSGTPNLKQIDPFNQQEFQETMEQWKSECQQRRIEMTKPFQQFDKHNRGHVTKSQFRQCLTIVGFRPTEKEFHSVESVFIDDQGFNYRPFIQFIQPNQSDKLRYQTLQNDFKQLNQQKILSEIEPLTNLQDVLQKIKGQVFRRRIRLYEWLKDHDKLNSGRLSIETFRRAINPCQLDLKQVEFSIIEDYYRSRLEPNSIEYKTFCDEIESIFTTDQLEKNPLVNNEQYQPRKESSMIQLNPDDEDRIQLLMSKLAQRVHQRRIQLFPLFEDFDRVRNGFVTQNQFLRVLNDLGLLSLLNGFEKENLLNKFRVQVGGRHDIDYLSFSHQINSLAGFEASTP